jgi:acyl-coenzyme A synthetase/AMP-(fatty) acid ligase
MASFGRIDFLTSLERMADDLAAVDVVAVVDQPGGGPWTSFEELEDAGPIDGAVDAPSTWPAVIAYTSGTTADPKGVVHSHRTLGAEIRQMVDEMPAEGAPYLMGAPVGHAIGMLGALLAPVLQAKPFHMIDAWDPGTVLRTMLEHQVAGGSGSTYFLQSLLDHPDLEPAHCELMRFTGLGGSSVPAAIAERARDLGILVIRKYGSTEHPSITGVRYAEPGRSGCTPTGTPASAWSSASSTTTATTSRRASRARS